jgi:hypothetical protein
MLESNKNDCVEIFIGLIKVKFDRKNLPIQRFVFIRRAEILEKRVEEFVIGHFNVTTRCVLEGTFD